MSAKAFAGVAGPAPVGAGLRRWARPWIGLALVATLGLSACSSDEDAQGEGGEHVWKEQTRAIDKAREVEDVLERAAKRTQDASP